MHCFTANVGQQAEDFAAVRAKALKCGACGVTISDLRTRFVTDFVFESLKANALYEQRYQLGTSIARPCIAFEQIRVAREVGAKFVAHGATGKGNDQVRFEMCAQSLAPEIVTIAPWRDQEFLETFKGGRVDLLAYCEARGIPVEAKPKANYSVDENLFHTSFESGMLEDADCRPDDSMYKMTVSPKLAPEESEVVQITFKDGLPVEFKCLKDGRTETDPLALFLLANEVGGRNGVGRIDIVENRFVGIKSRGVYETPGGSILRAAHLDIEGICMDREVKRLTEMMGNEFARLCYNGFWFAPEMNLVRNSIDFAQKGIDGVVSLELYKGNISCIGRKSDKSLYSTQLASMDVNDGGHAFDYNPKDSQGFIRINSVRLKTWSGLQSRIAKQAAEKK